MKKFLSLSLALLMVPALSPAGQFIPAGGTDYPPVRYREPGDGSIQQSALLPVLMMATVAAGGLLIIWIYIKNGNDFTCKRLVLESDCQCGQWTAIATNDVAEGSHVTNKWSVFYTIINSPTNDFCKFRIKVMPLP